MWKAEEGKRKYSASSAGIFSVSLFTGLAITTQSGEAAVALPLFYM